MIDCLTATLEPMWPARSAGCGVTMHFPIESRPIRWTHVVWAGRDRHVEVPGRCRAADGSAPGLVRSRIQASSQSNEMTEAWKSSSSSLSHDSTRKPLPDAPFHSLSAMVRFATQWSEYLCTCTSARYIAAAGDTMPSWGPSRVFIGRGVFQSMRLPAGGSLAGPLAGPRPWMVAPRPPRGATRPRSPRRAGRHPHQRTPSSRPTLCSGTASPLSLRVASTPSESSATSDSDAGARRHPRL